MRQPEVVMGCEQVTNLEDRLLWLVGVYARCVPTGQTQEVWWLVKVLDVPSGEHPEVEAWARATAIEVGLPFFPCSMVRHGVTTARVDNARGNV